MIGRAARLAWVTALVAACGDDRPPPVPPAQICTPGEKRCEGDVAIECDSAGRNLTRTSCVEMGGGCAPNVGCRPCVAGERHCLGDTPVVCRPEGGGFTLEEPCDRSAGLVCSLGSCQDLCAQRREEGSYIGCEYYAIQTANPQLAREFSFAVAIASAGAAEAHVHIENASFATDVIVPPDGLSVVPLPWVAELKGQGPFVYDRSVVARGAAFHITSDVPVTVHQFSPLEFRLSGDCVPALDDQLPGDGRCYSFTNDASLLLPVHTLTGRYMAISRPSLTVDLHEGGVLSEPGFIAVAAVAGGTTEVEVLLSTPAAPSADGAFAGGDAADSVTVTLSQGDVLQVLPRAPTTCANAVPADNDVVSRYCDNGSDTDLTGTIVRASQPVAMIGGHACAFIPFDRFACDHLEEQIPPAETWGNTYVVPRTHALADEPNIVRVLSATNGNRVELDPPLVEPFVLDAGQHRELETRTSFVVTASAPVLVAEFLVGQAYGSAELDGEAPAGDPAMALVPPIEQLRREYVVHVPSTYQQSWISVVAPAGIAVTLDDQVIDSLRAPVGSSTWELFETIIRPGEHDLVAAQPFAVFVHGFAAYTSYFYVGGLDLEPVIEPPF
ncbi:MAG: IgGFc-binding protein [Deltaproteobacteria bacterium]|nr:IgGFc-binding protein [Deltaproteobacteria bacterium]